MDGWMDGSCLRFKGRSIFVSYRLVLVAWLVGCGFTYSRDVALPTCIHTCTHTYLCTRWMDGWIGGKMILVEEGKDPRWTGGSVCGWRPRLRADHADEPSACRWMDGWIARVFQSTHGHDDQCQSVCVRV